VQAVRDDLIADGNDNIEMVRILMIDFIKRDNLFSIRLLNNHASNTEKRNPRNRSVDFAFLAGFLLNFMPCVLS